MPENGHVDSHNTQDDLGYIPSLSGRLVTPGWLVEALTRQFQRERGDGGLFLTSSERRKGLRDVCQYICAVESLQPSLDQQAWVLRRAYSELFGYGPLDPLIDDDRVSTIAIEGVNRIAVRYGPASDMRSMAPIFSDTRQLLGVMKRLLADAGADIDADVPVIETGLTVRDRPLRISVVTPSAAYELQADIRLHSRTAPTLEDLVSAEMLSGTAHQLLNGILQSDHGLAIIGDTESGKTTLLNALLPHLPQRPAVVLQRAPELRLPAEYIPMEVVWPSRSAEARNFSDRIDDALTTNPVCIILDEVRAEEAQAIRPLLTASKSMRQIWVMRGTADLKRVRSAMGMLARLSDMSRSEAQAQALFERLPFVVILKRRPQRLELREIGQWSLDGSAYPDYIPLYSAGSLTGNVPLLPIPALTDQFWQSAGSSQ